MAPIFTTRRNPWWRDRADCLVMAPIPDPDSRVEPEHDRWEQLWAEQLDEPLVRLCCIPFFANDLALGDVVEVGSSGEAD